MFDKAAFQRRLEHAILLRASQIGRRVTLEEFGADVAALEGREKSYKPATVKDWTAGRSEPSLSTIHAIARLIGASACWVAFNEGQGPANPLTDSAQPLPQPVTRRRKG